ncbi:MAG: endonuclease III domain-containing protein [Solirubrobacterales bacterium]
MHDLAGRLVTGLPAEGSAPPPRRAASARPAAARVPLASAARAAGWARPRRERVRAIRDRLRALYGRPANEPHGEPVHELVLTILSQNTNDRNRDLAYARLREAFTGWEEVRDAAPLAVADAIRPGGLADTKAPRIQNVLRLLGDPIDLDWLRAAPREVAIGYLTGLPGVGRKTAACVMIFSFDRPEIPVDTHVHRVGGRLGLFRERAPFGEAHEEMRAVTEPADAYELHVNLITHGRRVCRPKPRCGQCGLRKMCPAFREGRVTPLS